LKTVEGSSPPKVQILSPPPYTTGFQAIETLFLCLGFKDGIQIWQNL
jgi:hypothetical protein